MPTITIEVSDRVAGALTHVARVCSLELKPTSHGIIDATDLVTILVEDAAAVLLRPSSWEAEAVRLLLLRHGYEV